MALWLDEVDCDPERTGLGRQGIYNDCVRYAANRLRIRELLKRHPEIHDEQIRKPIIVVGLPRSGTTHLVNLLAADQRLRSMPLWRRSTRRLSWLSVSILLNLISVVGQVSAEKMRAVCRAIAVATGCD